MDTTNYWVFHEEETRATGSPAWSHIPSIGAATSAVDQYRIAGIASSDLDQFGAAFTDVQAVAAISKIAEGGIKNIGDLEAAETALQALLLHDVVHVITHSPKIDFGNGLISYLRLDHGIRTPFGFDLFRKHVSSRDFLIAPEFVTLDNGVVRDSTIPGSQIIGQPISSMTDKIAYWNPIVADAVNASLSQHGIPAYLTDPRLIRARRGDGFQKAFYHRLNISWKKSIGDFPPIICTFLLPPFLAIILNRLDRRENLSAAIAEVRSELAPVRAELTEFNQLLTSSVSQSEIDRRVARINASFDAIIPESRLSRAERAQRNFAVVHRLARPIVKFMAGFVMKTGVSLNDLTASAGDASAVFESRSIVDRTITAKTFASLIKTESIQSLVKHHFSLSEIDAIERSISQ